jgi:hypothetical protein
VRALAVTTRATAWLVVAGSARMTTRAPVMVLAVSLGAIQMTRQPEGKTASTRLVLPVPDVIQGFSSYEPCFRRSCRCCD